MNKSINSGKTNLRGKKGKLNKTTSSKNVCDVCHKKFRSRYHLKLHMAVHTGEKSYMCDICKKGYQQKWNLVTHVARVHSKEKPFECRDCGKAFGYSSHFKRHVKKHFLEKIKTSEAVKRRILNPHGCRFCEKSFDSNYRLDLHMRTHTGNRPFLCDKCGKRFVSKRVCALHIKKKHEEGIYFEGFQSDDPSIKNGTSDNKKLKISIQTNLDFRSIPKKEIIVCELCGKNITRNEIKSHLDIQHHTKICPCQFRKKEFLQNEPKFLEQWPVREKHSRGHAPHKYLLTHSKQCHVFRGNSGQSGTLFEAIENQTKRKMAPTNSIISAFNEVLQNKQPAVYIREKSTELGDTKMENAEKQKIAQETLELRLKQKYTGNETIEEFSKIANSWINQKFEESKQFTRKEKDFSSLTKVEVYHPKEETQKPSRYKQVSMASSNESQNFVISESSNKSSIEDIKQKINKKICDKIVESLRTSSVKDKVLEVVEKIKQKKGVDVLKEFFKEMLVVPENDVMVKSEGRVFWHCWLCQSKLASRHLLSRHLIIHEPEENHPFKCDICLKTFTQANNLKEHTMTHNNEHQYLCDMCGSGFRHKSHFNAHVRRHGTSCSDSPSKKYQCAYCGKKVHTNHQKKEHERTHTKERPYLCKICGQQFGASSTLSRHLAIHEEAKHQCSICLKLFKQKCSLKRHYGTHLETLS